MSRKQVRLRQSSAQSFSRVLHELGCTYRRVQMHCLGLMSQYEVIVPVHDPWVLLLICFGRFRLQAKNSSDVFLTLWNAQIVPSLQT